MRKPEIESLLNPAQERLQDDDFRQHQSDGLALFLAREFAQSFCLVERFEELAVVKLIFYTASEIVSYYHRVVVARAERGTTDAGSGIS